jgi:hypothetical protein
VNLSSSGAVVTRGSTLWSGFRRWPWWGQALLWCVFPIPLFLFACAKPEDERRPWFGLTLAATVLWVGCGVASAHDDHSGQAVAAAAPVASTSTTTTTEQHPSTTLALSPEGASRSGNGEDLAGGKATDALDRSNATTTLLAMLETLPVQAEGGRAGYDRALFKHWDDDDHDGCDTRCEVLSSQRRGDGSWLSEWDGYTTSNTSELQIDHVVALAEAWDSGADRWTAAQRDEFADYQPNLLAVTASENERKSDRDAAEWFPSRAEADCLWSSTVVRVKSHWHLSVDQAEHDALVNLLQTCSDFVAPTTTTAPTATTTTVPHVVAPPPTTQPPAVNGNVHPGAFCAPEGATGTTSLGTPMTCAGASCDGVPYQQPHWRKTYC